MDLMHLKNRFLSNILVLLLFHLTFFLQGTPVPFTDVTDESKIDFKHTSGASDRKYYLETMGAGAVFFDYDNDGNIDIYVVNTGYMPGTSKEKSPSNVLYRNNNDGTFTDVTKIAGVGHMGFGMGTAAADYDNDGDQDLYLVNFGPNVLYRNNNDGTFSDVTDQAGVGNSLWGISCAFLDFDNDRDLDITVINYLEYDFSDVPSIYDGLIGYSTPRLFKGTTDILYQNNNDGTFTDITGEAGLSNPVEGKGMGGIVADFDNDSFPDIYITNDTCRDFLYHNNGDGTFTDVAVLAGAAYDENGMAKSSMGVDCGDYNNDGWLDLFIVCTEINTLYQNNGDGTFTDETVAAGLGEPTHLLVGFSPSFLDYDNDGDLDIFVANGHFQDIIESLEATKTYAQSDQLYRNNGNGTFTDISSLFPNSYFSERYVGRATITGDYDNDGDVDIFVVNSNQEAILLRNEEGNNNNWIQIKLIGKQSNRDGIQARVQISCDGVKQMKEVKSGSCYASGSDKRLLFGLGKKDRIDFVQVNWPSKIIQTLENVMANQLLIITESK